MEDGVSIGAGTRIWHYAHLRHGAVIGQNVTIGMATYIDQDVRVPDGVKIQNHVNIFAGVVLSERVFIGPAVTFTNDRNPRAFVNHFTVAQTYIEEGASLGANATLLGNLTIGRLALVGAGAVVTQDVEPYALVLGNPARQVGWVCECGKRVSAPLPKRGTCIHV